MDFSVRQLQAFLQVARLKNFTRAAEQIYISQAGLSSMIQDLEQQLGCQLFERTTRTVALTKAGLEFLPAAERALEELLAAAERINQAVSSARRNLTVSTTPLLAATLFPRVCQAFQELRPDITVRIRDVERGEVQDLVDTGACDLGFGIFFKPASGIERKRIHDFTLLLVSCRNAQHEAGQPDATSVDSIQWKQLRDIPLIGLRPDIPAQRIVESHLERIGRANEDRPYYNNLQTVLAMVEAGFGSAILPSFVMGAIPRATLQFATLSNPHISLPFYKIAKKGRAQPEASKDFVKCFVEVTTQFFKQ